MKLKLTKEERQRIESVKAKIDNEYAATFTIQQLVHEFKINDYKLRHGFMKMYGLSIPAYQTKVRLEFATKLLKEDQDMTISKAAFDVGYNELSTFYRVFKKKYDMTPFEWRKRNGAVIALLILGYTFGIYPYPL